MFSTKSLLSSVLLAFAVASQANAAPAPASVLRKAPSVIPSVWQEAGATVDSDAFQFTVALKSGRMTELSAKMEEIAASGGAWLTEEQLKEYAAPTAAATAAVRSYLASHNIPESALSWSKLGDSVTVNSNIATVTKAFQVQQFSKYQVNGKTVARGKAYTLPSDIAEVVDDVYPLVNYAQVRRASTEFQPLTESELVAEKRDMEELELEKRATPASCSTASVTPACLRALYGTDGFTPVAGSNVAVGVMGYIDQYVSNTDLKSFNTKYRPEAANYSIPIILRNGAKNDATNAGIEAMLDVETVVSETYPLKTQFIAEGNSQTAGDIFLLTFNDFINNFSAATRPEVISISYGSDEKEFTASQANTMCTAAQKLTSLGTTIVVSSGDYGVAGQAGDTCPPFVPTYPGGCPYILSVGALQGFSPEVMVDKSLAGFYSGASSSKIFATPSYQSSVVAAYKPKIPSSASGQYSANGRFFPDVSAQGSKYVIIYNGKSGLVGGTSASAPLVASIFALVNNKRRQAGKGTIGYVHPTIYSGGSAFTDVTSGGSYGCGTSTTNGFPAASGWDSAAGWGSPTFSGLSSIFA